MVKMVIHSTEQTAYEMVFVVVGGGVAAATNEKKMDSRHRKL
jgi:hypothetical protein